MAGSYALAARFGGRLRYFRDASGDPTIPWFRILSAKESQIGFMHQRSRLQRMLGPFASQLSSREPQFESFALVEFLVSVVITDNSFNNVNTVPKDRSLDFGIRARHRLPGRPLDELRSIQKDKAKDGTDHKKLPEECCNESLDGKKCEEMCATITNTLDTKVKERDRLVMWSRNSDALIKMLQESLNARKNCPLATRYFLWRAFADHRRHRCRRASDDRNR